MKFFPATCIDNFYSDALSVRNFALSCDFTQDENGEWPGKRTKDLHLIDEYFFNEFCKKIFSIYYDFRHTKINWVVSTQFQLIEKMHEDKNSLKNTGWVHLDDRTLFAGIIYLNPDIDENSGTSIYSIKDSTRLEKSTAKLDFFRDRIDDNYDEKLLKHNSCFEETIRFQNKFNRLVMFDGNCYHKANNFYSSTSPRLTQTFFVLNVNSNSAFPIVRQSEFL